MTSAGEVFVVQLARASRKANRFVRHLQRADREDVIAAAMLWCWKNRESYSLTTTLDTWFVGAVRNAYQTWKRGEKKEATDFMAEIPTGDTTQARAEALEVATVLIRALPPGYKKVARLLMQGYTREEMKALGVDQYVIDSARSRIKQLRKLLPDDHEFRAALVRAKYPDSDDLTYAGGQIDREMEELDFPPAHGKDCPPCWRCKWFEGYMPGPRKEVRMEIVERSVKAAVLKTERRKKRIAKEVRDGNL